MNQKLILFFAIFLGILSTNYGQSKRFEKGLIVKNSGDTLKGYIKNVGLFERSQFVVFKEQEDSPSQKYTANEVKMYKIYPFTLYESGAVNIKETDNYTKMFLRKLVDGEIDLYRLDYEMRDWENPLYEHYNQFYYFKEGSINSLKELREDKYLTTLKTEVKVKCELELPEKRNQRLTDKSLTEVIVAYNNCLGKESIQFSSGNKGQLNTSFGISIGPVLSHIETSNSKFKDFSVDKKMGYNINFYVDQQIWKALHIKAGASYVHRKSEGKNIVTVPESFENNGAQLELYSQITLNQLYLPGQLKVNIPVNERITPFVAAGGYYGFGLKNTGEIDRTNFLYEDGVTTMYTESINPFSARINVTELGWLLSAGMQYRLNKQQELLLEFQLNDGGSDNSKEGNHYIHNSTMGLLLGINF